MVYAYQPVNPLNAFAQSFQMVRGIQDDNAARQQAQVEQAQKMQRQQSLQTAIQNLRINPSPEAIAEFGLQFPEMKEQMDGYFKTLSDAKKRTQTEAAQRIVLAQRTGGDVSAILEEYAVAAENARDPAMAKEFRDAAAIAKQNPEAAAETARLRLAFTDPDTYDKIYRSTAAIDNFEYFREILGPDKVEEIIGITPKDGIQVLPNGMVIAGPDSPLARQMGGAGMGSGLQTITTKEQLEALPDGAEFIGPDGLRRVKGGGGSNATGGFR